MKNTFKNILIITVLFISFFFVTITSYANNVFDDLSNQVFRLHILANSDTTEDQNLKLKVRDSIIEYMNVLTKDVTNKTDVEKIVKEHANDLQSCAETVIRNNGYSYPVTIEIGNFYFPTKNYANISFPAGFYDALRIKIGNAEGKNWWCSLFPPLCFVDISSGVVENSDEEILKENLTEEEFSLISSTSGDMKFKFKIIEFLNSKNIL